MPIYDFQCNDCSEGYEDYARAFDPSEVYPDICCPNCGSTNKKKTPSLPSAAVFTQKAGTSKMDNFEYRAGTDMEKAKGERRHAEELSHVGASPYNSIDDINHGKYFGEVQ